MTRINEFWLFAVACFLPLGLLCLGSASHGKNQGAKKEGILLQIYFQVSAKKAADFERMYDQSYVPALNKQQGYLRSNLLRILPERVVREIEAAETEFNYQMELVFDTEENRRKWVASKEHSQAWPQASAMAERVAWRGYDVVQSDQH